MTTGPTGAERAPRARTPRVVRVARWVLFALLIGSAALTLFGLPELQRAVAAGRSPPATLAIGPVLLGLFVVGYAAYRIALVRAGRYPAGKALVRIALIAAVGGVVAGLVLMPADRRAPGQGPVDLARPLLSSSPDVRALAAELARHRPPEEALLHVERLVELLEDASPEVRRQARLSLTALAGRDIGGEGNQAGERWRKHFQAAGEPQSPTRP